MHRFERIAHIVVILSIVFGAGGCSRRHHLFYNPAKEDVLLAIVLPRNALVVEPLMGVLYDEVVNYFTQCGYNLTTDQARAWRIELDIVRLSSSDELVTPDVMLYALCAHGVVHCRVRNEYGELALERDVHAHQWVYKPACPVQNREYLAYQYNDMCVSLAHSIEMLARSVFSMKK